MKDSTTKAALITGSAAIVAAVIVGLFGYISRPQVNEPAYNSHVNSNTSAPKLSASKAASEPPAYGSLFNDANPIPIGLDSVQIGTPLSALLTVFPNGVHSPHRYTVVMDKGPFKQIECIYMTVKKEIKVTMIFYDFRDSFAKDSVHKQALAAFGENKVIHKEEGKTLEWPDIDGYQLILNQYSYSVSNYRMLLQ